MKNNTPKISIIANFYKSEKYIPKLMKSIMAQTFKDFELIAVNDCSPGKDLQILKKYKQIFESNGLTLRIIDNKRNLGISFAKNEGIKAARGEYLTFMDGDDWLEPEALERMITPAIENNLDLVVANCFRSVLNGLKKKKLTSHCKFNYIYTKDEIIKEISGTIFGINQYSSLGYWGKLFKRSLLSLSEFEPQKTVLCEDIYFNFEFLMVCNKIMFIDYFAYNWRWGGISSASANKKEESFENWSFLEIYNDFYYKRLDYIVKYNLPDFRIPALIELFNILKSILTTSCCYSPSDKKAFSRKKYILSIIQLPAYQQIIGIRNNIYFEDKPYDKILIEMIESKDIDGLYNHFYSIYKKQWKNRLIRRVLSKLPN